ncbi:EamA family transporter [Microlunatus soli]|uniref:EamA family transporter n=1 Tax=Microlunatus soli TaxID=630515 RepID=UPI000B1F92A9|nr:EamA family transporter [Microlunatus soli]
MSGGSVRSWSPAIIDGLIASVGVAVQYLALAQASPSSGFWPVAAGRLSAVALILVPVIKAAPARPSVVDQLRAAVVGAGATVGLVLYLLATRQQLLTVAVVLASLYPALPVLLGVTLLHESVTRRQRVGLVGAGAAVVLLSIG